MRDDRFVRERRGGLLTDDRHKELMIWAIKCTGHIFRLAKKKHFSTCKEALDIARAWAEGKVPAGKTIAAARSIHKQARSIDDPVTIAVARSAGHAAATAHMADHSLGAALYGLKAVKLAGLSVEDERSWQNDQLTSGIREMILEARHQKEQHFRL